MISLVLLPVKVLTCMLEFHHGYGFKTDVGRNLRLGNDRHGRQKAGQQLGEMMADGRGGQQHRLAFGHDTFSAALFMDWMILWARPGSMAR